MKRFTVAFVLLQAATRWSILAAILFTEPETSDTVAHLLFGPARLHNEDPHLFLPAIGLREFHLLRFVAGELFWAGAAAAAALVLATIVRHARGNRN